MTDCGKKQSVAGGSGREREGAGGSGGCATRDSQWYHCGVTWTIVCVEESEVALFIYLFPENDFKSYIRL